MGVLYYPCILYCNYCSALSDILQSSRRLRCLWPVIDIVAICSDASIDLLFIDMIVHEWNWFGDCLKIASRRISNLLHGNSKSNLHQG